MEENEQRPQQYEISLNTKYLPSQREYMKSVLAIISRRFHSVALVALLYYESSRAAIPMAPEGIGQC